jgi:hypothetical protein
MSDETPRTDAILTEWMPKITAADGDAECKAVILGFVRVLGYHARDLERELAARTAERDEARRQIDAIATLYADCGDCSICPVETVSRCGHDQAKCIAAVREWSLAEARKGEG